MSRSTLSYLLGAALAGALVAGLLLSRPSVPVGVPDRGPPAPAGGQVPPASPTSVDEPPTASPPRPEPTPVVAEASPPAATREAASPGFDAAGLSARLLRGGTEAQALMQSWRGNGGPQPRWLAEALRDPDIRAALIALVLSAEDPLSLLALGLLAKARPYDAGEGLSLLAGFEQAQGDQRRALLLELVRAVYEPVVHPVTRRLREAYDAESLVEFRILLGSWSEHPEVWRALREAQADHPEDGELAAELTRFANQPHAEDARLVWRELLRSEHAAVRREALRQHIWLPAELSLLEQALLAHPEQLRNLPGLREMPVLSDPVTRESLFGNLSAGLGDNSKAQRLLELARTAWDD